jgi:ABC-2 type transport system permease protein
MKKILAAIKRFFKPSNRSLIRELVATDFRLRYQGSFLGYLWSLLRPLLMFGVLYLVFTHVIRIGNNVPHYPAYLLLGLVLWQFFIEATVGGMNAITGHSDLVRKVSIPKYTLIVSATLSAFVNFCLNLIVVFIFMVLGHVPFRTNILLAPIYIGELIVFCVGISFLLSTLYVKFRDIGHIWDVLLQALFYASPLIYSLAIVPHRFIKFVSLNPLAQILQDMRSVMITPKALTTKEVFHSQIGRIAPMIIVLVVLVFGAWYFRRNSKNFAEEL